MTKQQLLDTHFNFSANLELEVLVQDDASVRTVAKFRSLTINWEETQIFIGIDHCVKEKYGRQIELPPMGLVLGTSGTEVPVLNADLTPAIDSETNEPITVNESKYWKKLAWENPMPAAFKPVIENAIKSYYNMPSQPLAFILPS